MKLGRFLRTVRHLKPTQVYGRLWQRLYRPAPDLAPPPCRRPPSGIWTSPVEKPVTLIAPLRFRFLNEERVINTAADWDDPSVDRLWRYNLHYFDDLTAAESCSRTAWHHDLLHCWRDANPPAAGTAWEPYPISLRIVNWIKWVLSGNHLEGDLLHSLAIQVRHLAQRLEFHILGNHLFANAKALVYAGLFFHGEEADRWLTRGMTILAREVPEQILSDGGHFERSPMYHAIVLEDLLDLINVTRTYAAALAKRDSIGSAAWPERAVAMLSWLWNMTHPDGEIALFNDAAHGSAPRTVTLDAYARRLGLPSVSPNRDGITLLPASGYARLQNRTATLIADVGHLGPDYLPGHAHADTLSFELSLHGQRILVNCGTSCYGTGAERSRQRGTACHTTVEVNGENSSEVWGGFRVGRRARPFGLAAEQRPQGLYLTCSHDGYRHQPRAPLHTRSWLLTDRSLTVQDSVTGAPDTVTAHFHFHPHVNPDHVEGDEMGRIELSRPATTVAWQLQGAKGTLEDDLYCPEFGIQYPSRQLVAHVHAPACQFHLSWS